MCKVPLVIKLCNLHLYLHVFLGEIIILKNALSWFIYINYNEISRIVKVLYN